MNQNKTTGGNMSERVGARLRQLRKERALSITDLARMAEMHRSTVSKVEEGENVRPSTIRRLAEALDVPVTRLTRDSEVSV